MAPAAPYRSGVWRIGRLSDQAAVRSGGWRHGVVIRFGKARVELALDVGMGAATGEVQALVPSTAVPPLGPKGMKPRLSPLPTGWPS